MANLHPEKFFGAVTLGEKGQVVIPAEARKSLQLKRGEKLLAFGMDDEVIVFAKLERIERMMGAFTKGLKVLKKTIRSAHK